MTDLRIKMCYNKGMELRNFYNFAPVRKLETLKLQLLQKGEALEIKGTILLAKEGINAAICAHTTDHLVAMQHYIEEVLNIEVNPIITNLSEKDPDNHKLPFRKFKVKLKKEIVALGVEGLDPTCVTGHFVDSQDWNELIRDPMIITIDTRNAYEYYVGHFKGAVNPDTNVFREFVDYIESIDSRQYTRIAMYCTGGIRCEKVSSLMKKLSIDEVYQLKGGILTYFQQIPAQQSLWEGDCFVFDDRIAVDLEMRPSKITMDDLPQQLHTQKERSSHTGHIYKKIMSLVK